MKFVLKPDRLEGIMYRVADPELSELTVQPKDKFEVPVKKQ